LAPPRQAWADAFAEQARSDWDVYRLLAAHPTTPACHALHYLQMACEKVAKAYRCRDTATDLGDLLGRHVGFSKFLGAFLLSPSVRKSYRGRAGQLEALRRTARQLAGEVEKLAPAIDPIARPQNAEYPWAVDGEVITPCRYDYPSLSLLQHAGGRTFLKLVARALDDYEAVHIG